MVDLESSHIVGAALPTVKMLKNISLDMVRMAERHLDNFVIEPEHTLILRVLLKVALVREVNMIELSPVNRGCVVVNFCC